MKKSLLAIAVLGAVSSVSFAQTNVTVYGTIDTAVRSITNASADGGRQVSLENGIFEGSRLGFKGKEDLGGGTLAVFDLEAGFGSTTGQLDQQGQLFGNQAWIGLKDQYWGEIDAGRQYGLAYQTMGTYAPLGRGVATEQGHAAEVAWQTGLYGERFNNSLEYTKSIGPFTGKAQYSFGGVAGATSVGSTGAGALTYEEGPISVGGVYQQSKDANSNQLKVWGLGSSYNVGPATLFLSYFEAKRDPGFAAASNQTGGALYSTSLIANANTLLQRKDDVWTTGFTFQQTQALNYTLGYMHDKVKDETDFGTNGRVSTVYAVADYSFSKRTDVYAEIDHTTLGGGEVDNSDVLSIPGGSGRTGVSTGLRLKF
ncbi:MAG: porin [Burkholderiales bacterium]